jgi:Ca2+-binding RTX toxin-like protein
VDAGYDDDIVNGDGDADKLVGNRNADTMHGNERNDLMCDETYTVTAGAVPVLADIMAMNSTATSADPASYSIDCAAQSLGGAADNLYGDEGDDAIYCYAGNDVVDLGSGDDYAETGDGEDDVLLGSGTDTVFTGDERDRICEKTSDNAGLSDDIDAGSGNDAVYLHYGQLFTGAADLGLGSSQECAPWDGSSNPYTTSGGGTLTDCDVVITACPF